ncbi:MAG: DUF5050 domain-containing protein [Firmicutes bacterium]|nr:DUF5050 domain-containing protein [Bacillota bacterium]
MFRLKTILSFLIIIILSFSSLSCGGQSNSTVLSTSQTISNSIVFYSGRSGNNEIYKIDDNGNNLVNLSNNPADDNCPAVSPDGQKIAFVSNRNGVENIYVMSITGEEQEQVFHSNHNVTQPSWSSDGTKLAYIVDYGEYTEIWVFHFDGTDSLKITDNQYRDERPFFSPDMTQLLFMSNREGKYKIYLMNADGTNQTKIGIPSVDDGIGHFIFPQWHPDGNKIIYSYNNLSNHQAAIHIVNRDGTNDITITDAEGRNENPAFSADGEWVVFQSERDNNFEIYKIRADGTDLQRITNNNSWDGWASWTN